MNPNEQLDLSCMANRTNSKINHHIEHITKFHRNSLLLSASSGCSKDRTQRPEDRNICCKSMLLTGWLLSGSLIKKITIIAERLWFEMTLRHLNRKEKSMPVGLGYRRPWVDQWRPGP